MRAVLCFLPIPGVFPGKRISGKVRELIANNGVFK